MCLQQNCSGTKTRSLRRLMSGLYLLWKECTPPLVKKSKNPSSRQSLAEEILQVCFRSCILYQPFQKQSRNYHGCEPLPSTRTKPWIVCDELGGSVPSHSLRKWECRSPRIYSEGKRVLHRRRRMACYLGVQTSCGIEYVKARPVCLAKLELYI